MGKDPKELAEKVRELSGDAMGQAADQATPTDPFLSARGFETEMEQPGAMEVMRQKTTPAGN